MPSSKDIRACQPNFSLARVTSNLTIRGETAVLESHDKNRSLYGFFLRLRGVRFTAAAIPLHLLYYLYSTGSFAWVWLGVRWSRLGAGRRA